MRVRFKNKFRLVEYIRKQRGDPTFLKDFNIQNTIFEGLLRKITKSARHLLLLFHVVKSYLDLK